MKKAQENPQETSTIIEEFLKPDSLTDIQVKLTEEMGKDYFYVSKVQCSIDGITISKITDGAEAAIEHDVFIPWEEADLLVETILFAKKLYPQE